MGVVKGLGIVVLASFFVFACEERSGTATPEKKPESPLKKVDEKVDEILTGKDSNPADSNGDPPNEENGGPEEVPKIPVAEPVPGKPGYVISPYNGKWIDVTGVEPGTLMEDPHFKEEKKFFKVPEFPAEAAPPVEEKAVEEAPEDPA